MLSQPQITSELSTVEFLRNLEVELGGSFQVQANKEEWGCGTEGKAVTFLDELTDEEMESAQVWFSNRVYPRTAKTRLGKDAVKLVRFVRFDMERPDHTKPTEDEVFGMVKFFEENGARAAVVTPRGVHGYVVLSEGLDCSLSGESPVKVFAYHFLRNYKGSLVPDSPTWSRSNVSRFVPVLAFFNSGAVVLTPSEALNARNDKPIGRSKAVKACSMEQKSASFADCGVVAQILHAWCYGKSSAVVSAELQVTKEKIESTWSRYAKPELRGTKNEQDEAEIEKSEYRGRAGKKRHIRQRTFRRYADRWWAYQDCRDWGMNNQTLLSLILNCETFSLIKKNIMIAYNLTNDSDIATWATKDLEAQEAYSETHMDSEVAESVVEDVELVVKFMPDRFTTSNICDSLPNLGRRQVLRALNKLSYITADGEKGSCAGWVKGSPTTSVVETKQIGIIEKTITTEDVKTATIEVKPVVTANLPDFSAEICTMLAKVDIEIFLGPGGSGKTHALEHEVLNETYLQEGVLLPLTRPVEATILAPSNEIAIELQFNKLKRKVSTIHTGLSIPVIEDMNEFNSLWYEKKHRSSLVCVDEFSLVSQFTFWAILKRITGNKNKRTKLLVIGDDAQLPPVGGTGSTGEYPLRDLVALADAGVCGIKVRRFTGNKRVDAAATGLKEAIEEVRRGEMPKSGPGFELILVNEDLKYVGDRVMNTAANLIKQTGWQGLSALKGGVYGEKYGSQLIANKVVGSKELAVGDDVVCMVSDRRNQLAKGSKGFIKKIRSFGGEMSYGVKLDCLHKGQIKKLLRWLPRESLARQECRNAHTLQGSQMDYGIATLEKSRITTREMLYVQLSRLRKGCKLVTTISALQSALATTSEYVQSDWATALLLTHKNN